MAEQWQYTRPELYELQEQAIFSPARISVCEAGTKSGKTVGCMAWIFEKAWLGKKGWNFWWVAPYYAQARIAYTRMKDGLPPQVFRYNDNDMTLKLTNGTTIWFKSGDKPDTLYGEDVYGCVVDEASRLRQESWWAVRSTLTATRGPIRIIGNVKGKLNWAYKMARRAQDWYQRWDDGGRKGPQLYSYHKITCWDAVDAGVLDQQEIEDARADLPEAVFEELYEAQATEDGANPFGNTHIDACVLDFQPSGIPVVWGWDLARKRDWTVGIGLDEYGQQVRMERFKRSWPATIETIIEVTEQTVALVDSTGVGDAILGQLQRDGGTNYEGFIFSSKSKQQLMEGLAVAIQDAEVTYPNGVLVDELHTFEYVHSRTGVAYCVDDQTKILTDDLKWVPAGSLSAGDHLLAFDEMPPDGLRCRRWKLSEVLAADEIERPCSRVVLSDGTEIIASQEHQWLTHSGNKFVWKRTDALNATHPTSRSLRDAATRLVRLLPTWSDADGYAAGYLAAAFDGEGCLNQSERRPDQYTFRIAFAQRDNAMLGLVTEMLRQYGFRFSAHGGAGTNADVVNCEILGGFHEVLRFLGQIRPVRLMAGFDPDTLTAIRPMDSPHVVAVESLGDQPVVALGTSTKTFVAEGIASHNSAPEGMHDDCVCALALARQALVANQVAAADVW